MNCRHRYSVAIVGSGSGKPVANIFFSRQPSDDSCDRHSGIAATSLTYRIPQRIQVTSPCCTPVRVVSSHIVDESCNGLNAQNQVIGAIRPVRVNLDDLGTYPFQGTLQSFMTTGSSFHHSVREVDLDIIEV